MDQWLPHRHPASDVRLERPAWWDLAEDDEGLVLLAPETDLAGAPRSSLTVVWEETGAAPEGDDPVTDHVEELSRIVPDFQLLDLEASRVGSRPAYRVLVAGREDDASVTLEQWWLEADGATVTVSGLAPTMEYDEVADVFARVVASFGFPDDA